MNKKLAMNTQKRLLALFLVLLLITAFSPRSLGAELYAVDGGDPTSLIFRQIEATLLENSEGNSGKGWGCSKQAQLAKVEALVEDANARIEDLVVKAQNSEKDDVEKLLRQVEGIVSKVTKKAEQNGYEIECDYVTTVVDGQSVLIDPLRVVIRR
jgi:hypothetical protein